MTNEGIPRRTVETDPVAQMLEMIKAIGKAVDELQRSGTSLRNSSISGGEGLTVYDDAGLKRTVLRGDDGALVSYDSSGAPVARFGPLYSRPGEYGGEVMISGQWTALATLGQNSISWSAILSKPTTFAPSAHTHPGTDLTTPAPQADGSAYAFNNNVAGTTQYAVWVGNDGGYHFGKNTSSQRYKMNIRDYGVSPDAVLQLQPRIFDRKPVLVPPPEGEEGPGQSVPGAVDEYGLIAEEVAEHLPEIVVRDADGRIDGVRYDLLGLALLDVAKDQAAHIARQDQEIAAIKEALKTLGVTL